MRQNFCGQRKPLVTFVMRTFQTNRMENGPARLATLTYMALILQLRAVNQI